MSSDLSFLVLVRHHADDWPRVAELVSSLLHAASLRRLPVDRSSLFHLRNPAYWSRKTDELFHRYDAWRIWFNARDINAQNAEKELMAETIHALANGWMNMGKAYQRFAAYRRIALLEEFIRLKGVTAVWPPAEELLARDEEASRG